MSNIYVDYKDKNRFTNQLEITSGSSESLYFILSAGYTGVSDFVIGGDVYGDVEIFSYINLNYETTSNNVGSRYEGGAFFTSSTNGIIFNDMNDRTPVESYNGTDLGVSATVYGTLGIMKFIYENKNVSYNMTVMTTIDFMNIESNNFVIQVFNPPSPP